MLRIAGTITLLRTPTGWCAKFTGPAAAEIMRLFHTDTLPTAFSGKAKAADVEREMRKGWPLCHVTIGGQQ